MRRGLEFAEDDTVFLPVFRCPGLCSKLVFCFAYDVSDQKRFRTQSKSDIIVTIRDNRITTLWLNRRHNRHNQLGATSGVVKYYPLSSQQLLEFQELSPLPKCDSIVRKLQFWDRLTWAFKISINPSFCEGSRSIGFRTGVLLSV